MFLPLHDRNPLKVIPLQAVTAVIIVTCAGVFLWQLSLSEQALNLFQFRFGLIPALLLDHVSTYPKALNVPSEVTLLTGLFLHGGWLHLLGNMAYLWVFGDNIEDAMGHLRFALFYLLCGVLSFLVHAMMNPSSTSPLIGASGAVAGVLGAYLMLHPRVKVLVLAFNRVPLYLPAYILLAAWLAVQVYSAVAMPESAVAWWAHIGGFVCGAILVIPFKRREVPLFDADMEH